MNITALITKVINRENLSHDEMYQMMKSLMSGETTDIQNAGFLTALATKGETETEIQAAAEIMRELSTKVVLANNDTLVDPVGTGGTYSRVFNVSTASAITASCAGVKIAKHGSRSASSKSGSADFLEAAGVNINLTPMQMKSCVETLGIGFMYAPQLHTAMRHVMSARKGLGVRTIFNLLGPLTNPSGAKRQVLGVYSEKWLHTLAEVCQRLGQKQVMVVHSADGLDEISIADKTAVVELCDGKITEYTIDPKDFDIFHHDLEAVRVDSPSQSLQLIQRAFGGEHSAAFDMIALNTAAILSVSSLVSDMTVGYEQAVSILQSGQAQEKLAAYVSFTQQFRESV
ncbi:MAG: anthranilate phosphoribosyltransferase [Ostreibacterium sp.]